MKTGEHAPGGLRAHLPMAPKGEAHFHWRGSEVTRVEALTDAVFAFAVTLLVVALEVPRTFEGLLDVVRGFPAFVICFVLLMVFWTSHYRYHRRYGLEDGFTRTITMAILVLILFLVYPLKFLFTLVTDGLLGLDLPDAPHLQSLAQARTLYVVYGLAFAGAWGLYAVLYGYALRKRAQIGLDAVEVIYTKASLAAQLVYVFVCLLSIALALCDVRPWVPGSIYFLLGPLQALNGWWFGRRARAAVAGRS